MTEIRRTRLDNGLTLLSEEVHHSPVVALQAWVNVGSADEEESQAGIAHLHEHMLFKGTGRRGVGEVARIIEASGGEINAWTSFDQTVLHLVVISDEIDVGLDILTDALRHSSFDPLELSRETDVVVEEIRRGQDAPSRRVASALFALAYIEHPYRRPVLGTEATVRNLTRDGILAFYRQHYRPERITLVAVGDFRTDQLVAETDRLVGDWRPETGSEPLVRPVEGPMEGSRARVLREPVKESRLALAWHAPPLSGPDVVTLDALSVILGHGESSRLGRQTHRREGLVNDAYAHAYTPRDPGLFVVGAGLQAGNVQQALASVLQQIFRLRRELVSEEELDRAKVLMLSDSALNRQTVQGQARRRGFFEVVGGDYTFESSYLDALRKLRPADLRTAAIRYLTGSLSIVAQVPEGMELVEQQVTEIVSDAFRAAEAPRTVRRARERLDVTRAVLDNGATLLVRPEASPVVALRALAYGGLRWEDPQRCGISNLVASQWGLATEQWGPGELAHRVAMLGGSIAAFAGRNTSGLRAEFICERGAEGLDLFLQTALRPAFGADDLERERGLVLERIRNLDDSPAAVAFDLFVSTLFPTHPYGMRATGTEESVRGFSLDDIRAYHDRFLAPDKLVVAVVGNVEVEHAIDVLAQALDRPRRPPLPPLPPCDRPPTEPRRVTRHLAKNQAHLIVGTMGTTVYEPDRYVLEVLTKILSGQSGRLFLDLRDRQGLAYSVTSSTVDGLDPGHILVHVGTSPGNVEQASSAVHGHLAQLRRKEVTEEELHRAQRFLTGTHAIDLQHAGARAMTMALSERFAVGYDAHRRYAEGIRSVTVDAVRDAATRYFDPSRLVEVVVGPSKRLDDEANPC